MSASSSLEPREWSLARRVAFRFIFCYFVLYDFPSPLDAVPDIGPFAEFITNTWAKLVQPVAEAIFGVSADVLPNGSGDTTFNYVQIFVIAVLALIATMAWSFLDRHRRNYTRLAEWLRVYLRFVVGVAMISYGAFKVIKAQFPGASLDKLLEPYGDASPMGLLWTFMGASTLYNFFTGAGEMLGGLLLFARRTQLLGALITAAVMTHVAVLNFSYDVPVKLYSVHLLAQALYIALPDAKRVAQFFLTHPSPPLIARPRVRRIVTAIAAVAVLAYTALALKQSYDANREYGDMSKRSPLRGIWNVDEYVIDGAVHPPLITDATRWRRVVIDGPLIVTIHLMNEKRERYLSTLTGQKLLLKKRAPASTMSLTYRRPDKDTLIFEGKIDEHPVRATMHRDPREFLLLTRGFHWINEYPFNR